ncbi:MAG: MlaD family protein [Alphaproteobacteria bacterium]
MSFRQFFILFRLRLMGIAVMAGLLWATYMGLVKVGQCNSDGRMMLKGVFSSVDGVKRGTPILLAGLEVGEVCALTYLTDKNQVEILMAVEDNLNLAEDSGFAIVSYGLNEPKIINITPGGSFTNLANGDEIIYTLGTVAIEKLLLLVLERAESKTNLTKPTSNLE